MLFHGVTKQSRERNTNPLVLVIDEDSRVRKPVTELMRKTVRQAGQPHLCPRLPTAVRKCHKENRWEQDRSHMDFSLNGVMDVDRAQNCPSSNQICIKPRLERSQ